MIVAVLAVIAAAAIRLAVTPTFVGGYEVLDEYNIALRVLGASPTWRALTTHTETSTEVTIGLSEISLQLGPGFGDERVAYVAVRLRDALADRDVVDATTGILIPRIEP